MSNPLRAKPTRRCFFHPGPPIRLLPGGLCARVLAPGCRERRYHGFKNGESSAPQRTTDRPLGTRAAQRGGKAPSGRLPPLLGHRMGPPPSPLNGLPQPGGRRDIRRWPTEICAMWHMRRFATISHTVEYHAMWRDRPPRRPSIGGIRMIRRSERVGQAIVFEISGAVCLPPGGGSRPGSGGRGDGGEPA